MGLLVTPNPDDPLVASIAEMYQNNRFMLRIYKAYSRKGFEKIVKEYVKKYAA
jgi:ubiquitin-protein ligase